MTLNEELAAIEAVVNECEKMLADKNFNANAIADQILSIADPNASIAKTGEWIGILTGQIDKIPWLRLKELKHQYPNDSRIGTLGRRAAECFLTLYNISFDLTEQVVPPDVKPETQSQNQKMRTMLKTMVSDLISP